MEIHTQRPELMNQFDIVVAEKRPKTSVLTSHSIIIYLKDIRPFHFTANLKLDLPRRRFHVGDGHSSWYSVIASCPNYCILT